MTIYRGPGGTGEARTDTDVTEVRIIADEAEGYKDAAAASAVAAASSASAAATSETNAQTAETNAETAETNAETAQAAAEVAQAAAEAAQLAAEAAQTAAELAETNAETAEANAETAETNAETAQAAAEAALASAQAVYDNFDDRYLGPKSSDPTLDNDGNALLIGALYFNTSIPEMRVYSSGGWINFAAGGSVTSFNTRTGAVTLSSSDVTTALGYTPVQTVALTAGTGISTSGTSPNFTITNSAPDQTVALTQGGTTTITGTYPNFTISSADQYAGTVTSVGGTGTVNGLSLSGTVTSTGNLTLGGTLDLSSPPAIGGTSAAAGAFTTLAASGTTTLSGNQIISVTDNSNAALRITQLGTGNALLVEDDTNPDASPFVVTADGRVITGATQAYAADGETQQFQVQGVTQASSSALLANWSGSATSEPNLVFAHSRSGVIGTHTASIVNDNLGTIAFCGSDGSAFNAGVAILAEADGTWSGSSNPAKVAFLTVPSGSTSGVEAISLTSGQGLEISRTAVTSPVANDGNVFSGTYTPTLTNTTNVAASTAYACQYMRVGKVVTVSGRVNIDATTTATNTILGVSLPVASNFASAQQAGGTFSPSAAAQSVSGVVFADATNDRVSFRILIDSAAASDYYFTFTYQVI